MKLRHRHAWPLLRVDPLAGYLFFVPLIAIGHLALIQVFRLCRPLGIDDFAKDEKTMPQTWNSR